MTKIDRRDFLKLNGMALASLSLAGLSSCFKRSPLDSYSVFWLHIEGAPLRSLFDLFIDPFKHHPDIAHTAELKDYSADLGTFSFPSVWFKDGRPSPLLNNLLTVRGLSSASPHLKQCRDQWFKQKPFQDFIKSELEFSWSTQSSALDQIYNDVFSGPKQTQSTSEQHSLSELFSKWTMPSGSKPTLKLALINQFKKDHYFESTSSMTEESLNAQLDFYRELIAELEKFVSLLQKQKRFDRSAILITSDRARVVTSPNGSWPLKTEPMWQGLNVSLITEAITGPVTIGHILKEHPRYAESFPGTWGTSTEDWTPRHVHQLIADLCLPKGYDDQTTWVSDNPWLDRKPFNRFYIKQSPGQIL